MAFWSKLFRRNTSPEPAQQVSRAVSPYFAPLYGVPSAEKIQNGFDQFAQLAFASNATVYAVENRRLQVFGEATFKWRALDDKHLFGNADLAKLETPWPNGSTGDLLARMELDAALAGNAFVRDAGDRLERLRPDWVTIVSEVHDDPLGNQIREVIGYFYEPVGDPDREPEFFPVAEVAHWAPVPDPCANFRGMSWLTPVIREINADATMSSFRDAFFANAATANLIIKYGDAVPPERVQALKEQIAAKHTGSVNAFGTLVLDHGGDPMIVGSNMEGAAFDALQAAGETRIAAAGGVPAVVAGLRQGMADSAPGDYQAASRSFVDLTMRPLWRSACAALSKLVTVPAGAELWYDTSDVSALAQGESDKAATLQQLASTANTLIMAGYEPNSVTAALSSGDFSLLVHTGLVSVQMQQLSAPAASNPVPQGG